MPGKWPQCLSTEDPALIVPDMFPISRFRQSFAVLHLAHFHRWFLKFPLEGSAVPECFSLLHFSRSSKWSWRAKWALAMDQIWNSVIVIGLPFLLLGWQSWLIMQKPNWQKPCWSLDFHKPTWYAKFTRDLAHISYRCTQRRQLPWRCLPEYLRVICDLALMPYAMIGADDESMSGAWSLEWTMEEYPREVQGQKFP